MNFIEGKRSEQNELEIALLSGGQVTIPAGRFSARAGQPVTVGIRPTDFESADSGIEVSVEQVEQLGGESHIRARTRDHHKLTVCTTGQTPLSIGDKIHIGVARETIHLFDAQTGISLRV